MKVKAIQYHTIDHDKLLSKLKGIEMFWKNADKTKSQYFEFDEFYEIVQDKLDKHMIEESNNVLTFDMVKGTIHKLLVLNNKECLMWLQHQRAREITFCVISVNPLHIQCGKNV